MKKFYLWLGAAIFSVLLCGFVLLSMSQSYTDWEKTHSIEQTSAAASATDATITPEQWAQIWNWAIWILVIVAVIWIGSKIASSGHGLTIFVSIALLGAVGLFAYFFLYADKNNDGRPDAQVIRVIQPTGDNAVNDSINGQTNKTDAVSNFVNAGAFTLYIGAFLLAAFVIAGIAIAIKQIG